VGYLMKKTGFEPAPLVMAYILCPFMEEAFRQSLLKSHGDLTIFISRPISATILIMAFLFIAMNIFTGLKKKRKKLLEKIELENN